MAKTTSLMPGDAGPRERAISAAVAEWWDIPFHLLDAMWDPFRCAPEVLPHLARALGMPLWLERWTLPQKRSYVARWIALSRRRGVEGTFAELLAQVDAELVEFLNPPQGLFPKQHWTRAEREEWRRQFPELRVYPYRARHDRPGGFVVGGCLGRMVLRRSVAPDFAGRRAFIVRDGVERPLTLRVTGALGDVAAGQFRVALPTTAPKLILPAILGPRFVLRRSTAASRAYTFADGPGDPDLLLPGQPLAVTPERVRAAHPGRLRGFVVGHALPMRLRPSEAGEHVYDSLRLYDPAAAIRSGPVRKGGWILGRSKLRQDPFTLRLAVDASRRRPGGFVIGGCLPMVARAFDRERVEEVYAAVRAAKLGRDKVLIRFGLHRTITAGDAVPTDGTIRTGQTIRSL